MTNIIHKKIIQLLKDIGALANSMGYSAFLVGGPVRDILLGRKNADIDIVIEDNGIAVGRALSKQLKVDIIIHKHFGTCTLIAKDRLKIDFATARKETYKRPGAMPAIVPSSLKNDLARRDFTINAMAMSINKDDFGELIDPFGGEKDLKSGRIRVMHDKSFVDDPTRIFRAIRFAVRLDFAIEIHTLKLMKAAILNKMLEKVSKGRVRKELAIINKEKDSRKMLDRLAEFGM
jgi:tRNA nucleotidyltransferase (CCA-adding enzyme)